MRIVIANLPDDITEEKIREALKAFAPAENIRLAKESGTPSAVIELEVTRIYAETIAKRISAHSVDGRTLRAWVPTRSWE